MLFLIRLAIALVPGLFWLFFLAWRTRQDAGFRKMLLTVFLLGMTICIPAGHFNSSLQIATLGADSGGQIGSFLFFMFVVGPVEEGLKFLILYSEVYRRWHIRTPLDGVLLATASALGFATYENVIYMERFGFEVLYLRAWACTLAHVGFSAVFGHYLALAKLRRCHEKACLAEGLALAAALHGFYDFVLGLTEYALYPYVVGLVVLYTVLRKCDLRPLCVVFFPSLAQPVQSAVRLAAFRPQAFPAAKGESRQRADRAVEAMDADDEATRLSGLDLGRTLDDQTVYEKVQQLTHDPVPAVRSRAQAVAREMKGRLR